MTSRFRPVLPFLDEMAIRRFNSKMKKAGPDECWPWAGEKNNQGYGRFDTWTKGQRTRLLAHRVAFTLAAASEIGPRVLMHSCDNPPCCNPRHLRAGAQTDNMQDARQKGRANLAGLEIGRRMSRRGIKHRPKSHCRRGHLFDETNTKRTKDGRACKTCNKAAARQAYRERMAASVRQDVVEAACRGEWQELTLWERREAIDTLIRRGIADPDISRTLGVSKRTVNGRRSRLLVDSDQSGRAA